LEIDYFLHNLSDGELQRKQVLHHPITFHFGLAFNVVFADQVRVAVSLRSSHNFNMACSIAVSFIFSFTWRRSICVRMWAEYHSLSTLSQLTFLRKNNQKKEFRRAVRIELAKLRNEEKENILETRTKDTKMFHKLVRKNRRQGNDMIMELEV
jgi:hypothetical protein